MARGARPPKPHPKYGPGYNKPYSPEETYGVLESYINNADGGNRLEVLTNALVDVFGARDRGIGANLNFVCADHYLENRRYTCEFGPLRRFEAIARTYAYDLFKDSPLGGALKRGPGPLSEASPTARKWALIAVEDGILDFRLKDVPLGPELLRATIVVILRKTYKHQFDK